MAKAELSFENISFVEISAGLCTVGKVSINKDSNGQAKNDGGRVRVYGTKIINDGDKSNGIGKISITIGDAALTPKGFALVVKNGSADSDGRENFNYRSHNEEDRTITMNALHADGGGAKWKILVMVQHDDGRVGVIDPYIENEN